MTNLALNTREIAKVNNVAIMAGNDPKKLVPIKPICEALGIDYARQFQKLKDDEDLGPTIGLTPTVAADGKIREMVCLPMEFIFGWLFTINPKNVKPEAQEAVMSYTNTSPLTLASSIKSRNDKQKTGPVSKSSKRSSMKRRTN